MARVWGSAVAAGLVLGCEVAGPDDDVLPAALTGEGGVRACAPPESVALRVTLAPAPAEERAEFDCDVTEREGSGELVVLALACDEPRELAIEASPAPPGDAWRVGQRLRVTTIRAPDGAGGQDEWLRVESAGRLLLAAQAGGRIDPPEGAAWSSPFAWTAAPSTCMSEESACGASQRGAVFLQLSGGAPLHLYDGTSSLACEKGAFAAHVEAARAALPGSGCGSAFALGVLATR